MKRININQQNFSLAAMKNLAITVLLALIVMTGNSYLWSAKADSSPAPAPQPQPAAPTVSGTTTCNSDMRDFADSEFTKYQNWMEQNFSNKSRTSDLLDIGRQEFRQFSDTLQNKYNTIVQTQVAAPNADVTEQAQLFSDCQGVVDDYINRAELLMKTRVETSSAIKRTSVFIEKYQEINSKLREMDLSVLRMATNLASFQQKLPCYLKQCI